MDTTTTTTSPDEVLAYWFGDWNDAATIDRDDVRYTRWFGRSAEVDAEIRARFLPVCERAASGALDAAWGQDPRARLALVIVLDQLPRNVYRGSARAFAADPLALAHATRAIDAGDGEHLRLVERMFLHLPLSHAEELEPQRRAVTLAERVLELARVRSPANVALFEQALQSARRHCEIIERFGRFPHRNAAMGRTFTSDEIEFLQGPNSSF